MNFLDRTKQPKVKLIENISLLKPNEHKLDNGILFSYFDGGTQDVIKIECVFNAGTWFQEKNLVAFSTIKMLTEGTKNHSAAELAEIFDSYGAFVETEAEKDYSSISLYSLNRHLEKLLPVFIEMIRESVFPFDELSVLMENSKQNHLVSMQRVNYLARISFAQQIFGENHPYGKYANLNDYDNVTSSDLISFHKKYYHPGNLRIIAAGKINNSSTIELINKYFGDKTWKNQSETITTNFKINTNPKKSIFIPKDGALQSGIRIGKILFNKKKPDYLGVFILNVVLGGYFGSRLMSNIREKNGYTYGIGSGMISLKNSGYMYIASEVGADVREKALIEIYKEIKGLREKPINNEELNLVKNYLIGSFLRSIDGPFALSERFLGLLDYGFDFNEYYNNYILTIKNITSKQLLELANTYFAENSFCETIVGK
ncbi:MAG: insulinase family protein [Bacteroidetes bacterium]|nr:insulinase family protein [Bacteroidota bacterium]